MRTLPQDGETLRVDLLTEWFGAAHETAIRRGRHHDLYAVNGQHIAVPRHRTLGGKLSRRLREVASRP